MSKLSVLYFCVSDTSFVRKDIEILQSRYYVNKFIFDVSKGNKALVVFRQFVFLFKKIFGAKLIVIQFAGHHSFLPVLFSKLFFKKSIVVAGGTDCVSFPSINYGNFSKKGLAFTSAFSFRFCDLILPVHDTLVETNYNYDSDSPKKQGIKAFVKNLKTDIKIIYNGYDSDYWKDLNLKREKNSFLTVGNNIGGKIYGHKLKGTDLIFEVAYKFPNCKFYIIGGKNLADIKHPENVILLDVIPNNELISFYNKFEFYMQLSMSEGFPNALSESMLCGCIPIVTTVGAMKDIVGDLGYILFQRDVRQLTELIQRAIDSPNNDQLRSLVRKKIATNYPIKSRNAAFLEAINSLID